MTPRRHSKAAKSVRGTVAAFSSDGEAPTARL